MSERLTDKQLDAFIEGVSGGFISIGGDAALAALQEIKDRRARDLTPDEVEALSLARERISWLLNSSAASEYYSESYEDRHRHALSILDRLIAGRSGT